jgi:NAD(P)-dependent dehydrogenase (short-subunit alcohol dehydrogenase family)
MRVQGEVAIITGAGSSIRHAIATTLAVKGASILATLGTTRPGSPERSSVVLAKPARVPTRVGAAYLKVVFVPKIAVCALNSTRIVDTEPLLRPL